MKQVITEDSRIKRNTPRFSVTACQPSFSSVKNASFFSAAFDASPCRTTPVQVTVKKKVPMSRISSSRISEIVSRIPARSGEIRYRALPARLTRPLALE